ncbi:IQ calmodulin-binding motif protein, partial [Gregarina niphandrodes]
GKVVVLESPRSEAKPKHKPPKPGKVAVLESPRSEAKPKHKSSKPGKAALDWPRDAEVTPKHKPPKPGKVAVLESARSEANPKHKPPKPGKVTVLESPRSAKPKHKPPKPGKVAVLESPRDVKTKHKPPKPSKSRTSSVVLTSPGSHNALPPSSSLVSRPSALDGRSSALEGRPSMALLAPPAGAKPAAGLLEDHFASGYQEPVDLSFLPDSEQWLDLPHYALQCLLDLDVKVKQLHSLSRSFDTWTLSSFRYLGSNEALTEDFYTSGAMALLERGMTRYPVRVPYTSFCRLFSALVPEALRGVLQLCGPPPKLGRTNGGCEESPDSLVDAADPALVDVCKKATQKVLSDVYGLSQFEYQFGSTLLFLQHRTWLLLLAHSTHLVNAANGQDLAKVRRAVQTVVDRAKFLRLKHLVCRLQARWRLRLHERRMGSNRSLFFPLFLGILKTAYLLVPYVGISNVIENRRVPFKHGSKPSLGQFQAGAATTIQTWWRGVLAQRELRRLKEARVYASAAQFLQGLARTLLATGAMYGNAMGGRFISVWEEDLNRSIVKIQRSWRMFGDPRVREFVRMRNGLRALVLPVQRVASRLVFALAASAKWHARHLAEAGVEDALRRSLKDNLLLRAENFRAAVKIQACWRGCFVRRQFRALREACQVAQTFMKTQLARRRLVGARRAATKLQRWWRALLQLRARGLSRAAREAPAAPADALVVVWINALLHAINLPVHAATGRRRSLRTSAAELEAQVQASLRATELCHKGFTALFDEH